MSFGGRIACWTAVRPISCVGFLMSRDGYEAVRMQDA